MAITKPVKVPTKKIGSLDLDGWSGGLFLNGEQLAAGNQFIESKNVELSQKGRLRNRKSLQQWLPDAIDTVYEVSAVVAQGGVYNFVADDGKIRFCQDNDPGWTECGGDNSVTTNNGGKPTFLRALDALLILNGSNGDKLAYVDLTSPTFDVVKYDLVANPTTALSASPTGITNSGSFKIYAGYTYSSATGETEISDILEYTINKPRDQWDEDGSEYLTFTRPGTAPAGATYWNFYIALAANGGSIQSSDMLMLAPGLDLNTSKFVDNNTLAIDVGRGNPPTVNSTDGPRADLGIETDGRPILFGIKDEDGNDTGEIYIGGDGDKALDFSSANGGFRAEPSKGTNYFPSNVVGFRNNQGIPSLTVLFSNTQGISKQGILEQQTINYGNQSFVVWGFTEQNYGAAGVSSPYGVVNYKGQLMFASADGLVSMDTKAQLQNVLQIDNVDQDIEEYFRRVNVSALPEIVGAGWNNKFHFIVPAYGHTTPTEILIRDLDNGGSFYTLEIESQWIGVVSPPSSAAFVYICQGNKILKLYDTFGTVDYTSEGAKPFATSATGAMVGVNDAHNAYQAMVQAVFYILDIVGEITVGIRYKDQNERIRVKEKTFEGPTYVRSSSGGFSDPMYVYNSQPSPNLQQSTQFTESSSSLNKVDKRIKVPINDLASEVQWYYRTPVGYNSYLLRTISYEGENLGVKPDLR